MVGESVGGYRIIKQIGAGGMGAVYLAEHKLIGRRAAVKVLLPQYSSNKEIVRRFFNEARAATKVRSASIVEVYDFGYHDDGSAFIVMEFLEGEPLKDRLLRHTRFEVPDALRLARQIARALEAAHQQGIVHRDLKPDNVFIVPDAEVASGERIKLLDFGIAKLTEDSGLGSDKTRTGTVMGTPAYMAPEQCKGAVDIDLRADLYAVGCILFQMLCGRPPFTAASGGELIAQQILMPPPAPVTIADDIPAGINDLVLTLLAKEPEQRPASATEFIASIDTLGVALGLANWSTTGLHSQPPSAVPTGANLPSDTTLSASAHTSEQSQAKPTRSRMLSAMLVSISVILVAVVAGFVWLTPEDPTTQPTVATAALSADAAVPVADANLSSQADAMVVDASSVSAAPEATTIQVESDPSGASVYRDDAHLGVTPLTIKLSGTELGLLRFSKKGYATIRIDPDKAVRKGRLSVTMTRSKKRIKPQKKHSARERATDRPSNQPKPKKEAKPDERSGERNKVYDPF